MNSGQEIYIRGPHQMFASSLVGGQEVDEKDVEDLLEMLEWKSGESKNNESPEIETQEQSGLFDSSGYPRDCFSTISEDLICGVCREVARNPLNLPCPHLFCENCLKRTWNSNHESKCPICRCLVPTDKLGLSSYSIKIISALPIKCPYHEKGCNWTGTIGLKESILMNHFQNACTWGGYEKCKACGLKVWKNDAPDHVRTCREAEAKCEFCDFRGPNKFVRVHKAIGEYNQRPCASTQRCIMLGCEVLIPINELEKHLRTQCEKFMGICYGCKEQHYMPKWRLQSHIDECKNDAGWFEHWVKETTRPAQVGDLRYLGYENTTYDFGNHNRVVSVICKIVEVTKQADGESSFFVTECIPGNIRVPNNDVYTGSPPSMLSRKTHREMSSIALDCLNHYECSFGLMRESYLEQPFYRCRTCSGAPNTGVCTVCAVECHFGHELELLHTSGGNFCDCATGSIKLVGIKHCQAASSIPIKTVQVESKDEKFDPEMNVLITVRGDLTIDTKIRIQPKKRGKTGLRPLKKVESRITSPELESQQ